MPRASAAQPDSGTPFPAREGGRGVRSAPLRPAAFARLYLRAIDAAEDRRRRRKRDTTPDAIGLGIKRGLLERAAEQDPAPEAFEGWLLHQALAAAASGPVRALCSEILDEYRFTLRDPAYRLWLVEGAYSADAAEDDDHREPKQILDLE